MTISYCDRTFGGGGCFTKYYLKTTKCEVWSDEMPTLKSLERFKFDQLIEGELHVRWIYLSKYIWYLFSGF